MKRIIAIVCWPLAALLVSGCAVDSTGSPADGPIGEVEGALVDSNALNPNALNPNALNPNALNPNALNPNALDPSALAALQDPGESGDLSRQLLSYTVGCALAPTQSFSFTWRDSANVEHAETFTGLLGLATSWATKALDLAGQRWVSACLASRVNWYGVSVMLSSRGAHVNLRSQSAAERSGYPSEEGAFFGNLFATNPVVYACYTQPNVAHSRSLFRDCAAGHVESNGNVVNCGPVQILGSCADYCEPLDAVGLYYPACARVVGGSSIVNVVTTFLP